MIDFPNNSFLSTSDMYKQLILALLLATFTLSCKPPVASNLGEVQRSFSFVNQEGEAVTTKTVEGKVYVTDFFFTSCPSICPVMKSQMIRVYEKFKDREDFLLLSHSIDQNDSVPVLKEYASRLGISSDTWHMVTGERTEIFEMAKEYSIKAGVDKDAPGGYMHSGAFILVDEKQAIKGLYDGTNKESVSQLIEDLESLFAEKDKKASK